MPTAIGVPIKLLHEAEGHIITVELMSGELFRGLLKSAEDSMNIQMSTVTATSRDGRQTKLQHVFIRGSKVRFMIFPDMLKKAPMFARIDPKNKQKIGTGLGIGRGMRVRGRGGGVGARGGRGGMGRGAPMGRGGGGM